MNGSEIKQKLREGANVYGTLVASTSPVWPARVKQAGVDFVFIDTEHIPIDRVTLSWMCQTFSALGIAPLVRIAEPDPFLATMALDGGAQGILAPYVETPKQVRELSGAVHWRPLKGRRLEAMLEGAEPLEPELGRYLEQRNANCFLAVNIESVPAMQALDEILAVPDLDMVIIGPHDLSCSLGIPEQYAHTRFLEAVRTIGSSVRKRGIGFGIHYWADAARQIAWMRESANVVLHHSDISLFLQGLTRDLNEIRAATEPETESLLGAAMEG
jgi:2-keto-3-deoxy-L-rhamnonate aldolase RhmA